MKLENNASRSRYQLHELWASWTSIYHPFVLNLGLTFESEEIAKNILKPSEEVAWIPVPYNWRKLSRVVPFDMVKNNFAALDSIFELKYNSIMRHIKHMI